MKTKLLAVSLTLAVLSLSAQAKDKDLKLLSKPSLSVALADKAASACIAHQESKKGPSVAVAVFDASGNMMFFKRMDGTITGASSVAMQKAKSSALIPLPTAQLANWVKDSPGLGHVDGLLAVQGALPIFSASGVHLGAIGVSGAPAEEDEQCAQIGIDSIAEHLK